MSGAVSLESGQGLGRYLQEIRRYPILSVEDEQMLARR